MVVLDNVRSAYNVGSVFRTCDAFAAEKIFLCGITAFPPHKEIKKTALGAEETVLWKYFKTTAAAIKETREAGYVVYAVEQTENSIPLNYISALRSKGMGFALIFGNEVNGVQQEIIEACDGCIEIPQGGTKHSLNIAVSAGVVLWEIFRQRMKSK